MSLRIRSPQLREYLEEKLGQVSYSSATGAYTIDGDLTVTGAITQAAGAVVVDTSYLGALTVGVDATGYDVKFYGDTTGYYWLWDMNQDTNGGMTVVGTSVLTGAVTVTGAVGITGALTQVGNVTVDGTLSAGANTAGHDFQVFGESSDGVYMLWDASGDALLLVGAALTVTGTITVGENDTGQDVKFYGATDGSYLYWDETNDLLELNGADLRLDDGDILQFGDAPDVQIRWDGTDLDVLAAADGSIFKFGNGTADFDIWIYGGSSTVVFDEGGAVATFDGYDIWLKDDDIIEFGDGKDVTITWDPDVLEIDCAADDTVMYIGNGTNSFDIHIFGNTADDNIIFDASAKTLNFDGIDVQLEDADILSFGDADDITMNFDATNFEIEGAAANTSFLIGADSHLLNVTLKGTLTVGKNDTSHDVKFFGATDGSYLLWDESDDRLEFVNSYLELGTSVSPTALTYDGKKILGIYTTCESENAGTNYEPVIFNTVMTGAGQVGGRVKINMETDVTLGAWANALKAQVDCKDDGGAAGLLSTICAEMIFPASASKGNTQILELEAVCPASWDPSDAHYTSFIGFNASGATVGEMDDHGFLFDIQGLTADTGHLIGVNTEAKTTLDFANWKLIKIKIGTDTHYIPVAKAITATAG